MSITHPANVWSSSQSIQSSSGAVAHQVRQMNVVLTTGRMLATQAAKH